MVSPSLLSAALAVLLPATPPTPLATAKGLAQTYMNAIATRNGDWFEKSTASDFVYITVKHRKEDRAQAIGELKSGFKAMKEDPKVQIKVVSAHKAEGGLLIVHDLSVVTTVEFGKPKPSVLEFRTRQEVLFSPQGKSWTLKRIKILRDATTIDGKALSL